MSIDPEYKRWKKMHPVFPGVHKCVEVLKKTNTKGALLDIICAELAEHASSCLEDLISLFRTEEDLKIRTLLLATIAESGDEKTLQVLEEMLHSENERLKTWAIHGLRKIGSKKSRLILWEAGEKDLD